MSGSRFAATVARQHESTRSCKRRGVNRCGGQGRNRRPRGLTNAGGCDRSQAHEMQVASNLHIARRSLDETRRTPNRAARMKGAVVPPGRGADPARPRHCCPLSIHVEQRATPTRRHPALGGRNTRMARATSQQLPARLRWLKTHRAERGVTTGRLSQASSVGREMPMWFAMLDLLQDWVESSELHARANWSTRCR